jgi:hypothetical protein
MEERAGDAAIRVETGALETSDRYAWQLALAALGWVLALALVVWLAFEATAIEVRVTLFLVGVCIVIAITAVALAVAVLRPSLVRGRARGLELEPLPQAISLDALGRPVEVGPGLAELVGVITVEPSGGVRRYRSTDVRP